MVRLAEWEELQHHPASAGKSIVRLGVDKRHLLLLRPGCQVVQSSQLRGGDPEARVDGQRPLLGREAGGELQVQRVGEGGFHNLLRRCGDPSTGALGVLHRYYVPSDLDDCWCACMYAARPFEGRRMDLSEPNLCLCAGREIHVVTFEKGRVLEDEGWQAPSYCFRDGKPGGNKVVKPGVEQMELLDSSLHDWRRSPAVSSK